MSGIFGVARRRDGFDAAGTATAIAGAATLFPWQRPVLLEAGDGEVVLGAVVDADRSPDPAGLTAREGPLACVLAGYLVRARSDCGAGPLIAADRYAAAALAAYRHLGEEFAAHLEGPFALLLHDAERRIVIAANSRIAGDHIYRHVGEAAAVYGTLLGPLAACGAFVPRPDPLGIGDMLVYRQLMGTETILADVSVLEPASVDTYDLAARSHRCRRYWTYADKGPHRTDLSYRRNLDDVCETLVAGAARITQRPLRYVSGLSGGYDSRLVTALAAQQRPDLVTWTFGTPESPDMRVAVEVSRELGLEHIRFPLSLDRTPHYADDYATTVDGCISVDFAFGFDRCFALRERADVVLNGFAGDVVLGGSVLGPRLKILARNLRSGRLGGKNVVSPWLAGNRTVDTLATYINLKYGGRTRLAAMLPVKPPTIEERLHEELAAMASVVPLPYCGEQWILETRAKRWTFMGVASDRHFYADGSLFYDYDIHDRCLAVPFKFREEHRLYADVFRRLAPELGAIENGNTGCRMDSPPWRTRLHTTTARAAKKLARRRPGPDVTGRDLATVSRTVNRRFFTDLLMQPRTLERSLWDGDALGRLFRDHMDGTCDASAEVSLVAAVELFLRRWVDPAQGDR